MPAKTKTGSLVIVGTGIAMGQMTMEAREYILTARHIVALVADAVTVAWLKKHNPHTESLHHFYAEGKDRQVTYEEIVGYVMSRLRKGHDLCFVLYGHPGVFAFPPHELIRRTRRENIPARMLPAVSAEDCLFADLNVDPGSRGCQSFEATDFLLRQRRFDPCSALVLWQFGVIGETSCPVKMRRDWVELLVNRLKCSYPAEHRVVLYEAAVYPFYEPVCQRVRLDRLPRTRYRPISTLYVPPLPDRPTNRLIRRRLDTQNRTVSSQRASKSQPSLVEPGRSPQK